MRTHAENERARESERARWAHRSFISRCLGVGGGRRGAVDVDLNHVQARKEMLLVVVGVRAMMERQQ